MSQNPPTKAAGEGRSPEGRQRPAEAPRASRLAIASLASAAVFCIIAAAVHQVPGLGLAGLVSLVLGLVAIGQMRRGGGQVTGLSLAMAGAAVSALLVAYTGASLYTLRMHDLAARRARLVERDLTRLTSAFWRYSAKHHHAFPPADSWLQTFEDEGLLEQGSVGAPADAEAARHYSMNVFVAGLTSDDIKDRARTVLFFECEAGGPQAGGPGNLRRSTPYSHDPRGHVIAFADGHCEFRTGRALNGLNWLPQGQLVCPQCHQVVEIPPDWTPDKLLECPYCGLMLREPRRAAAQ